MFQGFTEWLEVTPLSMMFADTSNFSTWLIIPVSQCIHIIAIAILLISVGILNLRLLGLGSKRQNFSQLANHLMPWIWSALTVLFITGTIQTIAEPGRELLNIGFKTKMVLLIMAVAITMIYESTVKRDRHYWEQSARRRQLGRVLAMTSIVLWIGIAAAGRLIAYLGVGQF